MSEGKVEVVKLGPLERHPNADALSIVQVLGGYPCIVRTAEWSEGDMAVYVPIDSIVPDTSDFAFLRGHRRIRAARLRGVFSMGLLIKPAADMREGDDVGERLGIVRWEPAAETLSTYAACESPPKGYVIPCYTDIEGLRRHRGILAEGEEVVISEKIHGCNGRYMHDGARLWVGSRTQIKRQDDSNMWWRIAAQLQMADRLASIPMHVIFGEVYGQVQDLKYGVCVAFRAFDVWSVSRGCYLDHDEARAVAVECMGLQWVPELYRGPWEPALVSFAEGASALAPHVREGFVVKPVRERYDACCGRVILKQHGEGYLTRKGLK